MKLLCLTLSAVLFATLGFAAEKKATSAPHSAPKAITFTNVVKDGKKMWTPALSEVPHGQEIEAVLVNTAAEPHGFEIPGVVDPMVVQPGKSEHVKFTLPKAGHYQVKCQLHPAHVGAEINAK